MKTLYVTDLDGTLLNNQKQISNWSKERLRQWIAQGINFTVATARTPATVVPLLEGIEMTLPIIVMNGSFIYDIATNRYIYTSELPRTSVKAILALAETAGKQLFMYTATDEGLTVYYKGFNNKDEEDFYNERKALKLKRFVHVEDYPVDTDVKIGQLVMIDKYEVIKDMYDQVTGLPGIKALMYRDVNTEEGYLLEIAAKGNNKAQGIEKLKALYDMQEVVAFGDNLNDYEMIEAADCGCVMGNGEVAVKEIADYVIGTNDENGVVRFIEEQLNKMSA